MGSKPIPQYDGRGRPRVYPPAMVGDRFGQWTVIAYWLPDTEHGNARRVCVKCSCGVWRVHRENLLVGGLTKSCGHMTRPYGLMVVRGVERDTHKAKAARLEAIERVRQQVDAIAINVLREESRKDPEAA